MKKTPKKKPSLLQQEAKMMKLEKLIAERDAADQANAGGLRHGGGPGGPGPCARPSAPRHFV